MRKGSLSLSINAIVVLILAVAMLGLGLGFTKSMFSKIGGSLEIPPPNIPATEQDPIALPSEVVEFNHNKNAELGFNFYNDGTHTFLSGQTNNFQAGMKCGTIDLVGLTTGGIVTAPQTVDTATYVPFKIVFPKVMFTNAPLTSPTSVVCVLRVCPGTTCAATTAGQIQKQIVIKVK